FLDDSADGGNDFGAFVCKQLPSKTETQCGSKLPSGVTTTITGGRRRSDPVSSVTFTVDGDHDNLVFYAIESEDALNKVTAELSIRGSNTLERPAILLATPEPRLGSVLLAVLLLLAVSIHMRRM